MLKSRYSIVASTKCDISNVVFGLYKNISFRYIITDKMIIWIDFIKLIIYVIYTDTMTKTDFGSKLLALLLLTIVIHMTSSDGRLNETNYY